MQRNIKPSRTNIKSWSSICGNPGHTVTKTTWLVFLPVSAHFSALRLGVQQLQPPQLGLPLPCLGAVCSHSAPAHVYLCTQVTQNTLWDEYRCKPSCFHGSLRVYPRDCSLKAACRCLQLSKVCMEDCLQVSPAGTSHCYILIFLESPLQLHSQNFPGESMQGLQPHSLPAFFFFSKSQWKPPWLFCMPARWASSTWCQGLWLA